MTINEMIQNNNIEMDISKVKVQRGNNPWDTEDYEWDNDYDCYMMSDTPLDENKAFNEWEIKKISAEISGYNASLVIVVIAK